MPFVKLDCDILDSSLWDWTPERHIFITALLMAKPHELKEPTQQLKVDSLESTGWTVPPGKYGLVKASGSMIVKKALTLSHVDCLDDDPDYVDGMKALEALGNPDKDSRSQAFDGRRLVRIDGGYIALNFQHYRDKDHTAAERKRRQRAREKEEMSRGDVTDGHNGSPKVTEAEAEAEAYKEIKHGAKAPPVSPDVRKVFTHWQTVCGKEKYTLTPERRTIIKARLRDFSVDQLKQAIEVAHSDPFYRGENNRNTEYLDFKTIFKNSGKVEEFLYKTPPPNGTRGCDICLNHPDKDVLTVKGGGYIYHRETNTVTKCECNGAT